jgi:hypothetical protein
MNMQIINIYSYRIHNIYINIYTHIHTYTPIYMKRVTLTLTLMVNVFG